VQIEAGQIQVRYYPSCIERVKQSDDARSQIGLHASVVAVLKQPL
jgi:hypothetical protein